MKRDKQLLAKILTTMEAMQDVSLAADKIQVEIKRDSPVLVSDVTLHLHLLQDLGWVSHGEHGWRLTSAGYDKLEGNDLSVWKK